jgi:hypothetical protein
MARHIVMASGLLALIPPASWAQPTTVELYEQAFKRIELTQEELPILSTANVSHGF